MRVAGADVGRPHVQADRFNPGSLLFVEGVEVGRQTFFLAAFADVFNRRRFVIAHQCHVVMPFGDRFLVHPDASGHRTALGRPASQYRPLHHVPRLVPTEPQYRRRLLDVGRSEHVDGQYFKQVSKPASCFRPRQPRLPYTMHRTIHSRRACVQVRQKLATVQVPPHPLGMMVVHRQFLPAFRATKPASLRMLHMHIDPLLAHVQFHSLHRPGTAQPQQTLVQLLAFHRAPSLASLRDSVPFTHSIV